MSNSANSTRLHRFAISTVCVAMVTVVMGALTTSKNAGMAFRDWPTSDGVNMLTYPWLADFARNWDKFLEHGHRLAGALIGMWSIALVIIAYRTPSESRWPRLIALGVLLGVICQGLLGGFRVQLDERGLAMLHGFFAALVFSLMGCLVTITGWRWNNNEQETDRFTDLIMRITAGLTVVLLGLQYILGGLIRHHGTGLHEHLGLGLLALGFMFVSATISSSSNSEWIRSSAWKLLMVTVVQVALGAGAWVSKFGFAQLGYVATADSILQVALRTSHTVWGIVLFMTAVVHALKVFRVSANSEFEPETTFEVRSITPVGGNS